MPDFSPGSLQAAFLAANPAYAEAAMVPGGLARLVGDGAFRSRLTQFLIAHRAGATRVAAIPDVICQFWHDTAAIPADVLDCLRTWDAAVAEGFEIRLFDDQSALDLIADDFSAREAEAYRQCHHPAMRSDYFRLAYLLLHGSWYVDQDERLTGGGNLRNLTAGASLCLQPLCVDGAGATRMVPAAEFVAAPPGRPGWFFYVNNNPIMAAPGHAVIRRALHRATDLILAAARSGKRPDIGNTTGPTNITLSLVEHVMAGADDPLRLLTGWDSVCHSPWDLEYRSDARNWRSNADFYGVYT